MKLTLYKYSWHMPILVLFLILICVNFGLSGGRGDSDSRNDRGSYLYLHPLKSFDLYCLSNNIEWDKYNEYFIRESMEWAESDSVLDSIKAFNVAAADTNAVFCVEIDEYNDYLVTITRIGDDIFKDTLIVFDQLDSENWLRKSNLVVGSARDSVLLIINNGLSFIGHEAAILIKIFPENKWDIMYEFNRSIIGSYLVSDISQIMFCLTANWQNYPAGTVYIYDLRLDSLIPQSHLGDNIFMAKRKTSGSPIYFVSSFEHPEGRNLFKYTDSVGIEKITDYQIPRYVGGLDISDNTLFYSVGNLEDRDDYQNLQLYLHD